MTVKEILNKHKDCNFLVIDNQRGERILETNDLRNLNKDILNKEVEECYHYYDIYTSENYEGREFIVAELDILAIILKKDWTTTVRDLLTAAEDYLEVKIMKDGKTLFWNEIDGLHDIEEEILNMKVLKYDYETVTVLDSIMSASYNIIVIEVE